jgi:hypothetical protein
MFALLEEVFQLTFSRFEPYCAYLRHLLTNHQHQHINMLGLSFFGFWNKITAIFHPHSDESSRPSPSPPHEQSEVLTLALPPPTAWPAEYRYTEWDLLTKSMQDVASDYLSYREFTWNFPGLNSIEETCFEGLKKKEQAGAQAIGLDEDDWDCWVNHYEDYHWWEMKDEGVDGCYEALGWNETSWENATFVPPPATEEASWSALSPTEKSAAECVCFFQDLWDGELPLAAYNLTESFN